MSVIPFSLCFFKKIAHRNKLCLDLQKDQALVRSKVRACHFHQNTNFYQPMMKYTYQEIAGMIDHALLHPTLNDDELKKGCELCDQFQVATVCVKPYHVSYASEILKHSQVLVSCVVGFPHGSVSSESKRYETELACLHGAREIDMVVNIGKAMSGDWEFVEDDIKGVVQEASKHQSLVKVIFETDYLTEGGAGLSRKDLIKKLCEVSKSAGANWVKTSTGFGFVKQAQGGFSCVGAQLEDVQVMMEASSAMIEVKASGGVRDLDTLIQFRDLGATRCGTSSTQSILTEYNRRLNGENPENQTQPVSNQEY